MNDHFRDACKFLNLAASHRESRDLPHNSMQATLFFALGVERLLKGILFDLNPAFVLKDPGFKNALPVLHADRILKNARAAKELANAPDKELIALRPSIVRAATVSESADRHRGVMFRLAEYRDAICHRSLDELEDSTMVEILWRDFGTLTKSFSDELEIPLETLVGKTVREKREETDRADAVQRLVMELAVHKRHYGTVSKSDPEYDAAAAKKTSVLLGTGRPGDWFYVDISCPACGNEALLRGEVEYDLVDRESIPIGVYASALHCEYCDLRLDDPFDIDHLELHHYLVPDREFD